MEYIALLRGINVGGNRKVEMKRLKALFEASGYTEVSTYLNSGNVLFSSSREQGSVQKEIPGLLQKEFGFEISTLILNRKDARRIAEAIPPEWENNAEQKTDIAYLFPEIDSPDTIEKLPLMKEYMDIRYVKGAIIWNIQKKEYNKSRLSKITGTREYQLMTVRNVNTARFLAGKS
ncbi:MAG: DUF1697 domain-containing protein [Spirochaetales bacterium]|nr:DUF1697 domain-containing protein [Spirochaetales bacterium]